MTNTTRSIFISYETKTGLKYAREAKRIFKKAGYRTWMWEDDHKVTGYPAEDIYENIEACYFFLCICTQNTVSSGQRSEYNQAYTSNKQLLILTFDENYLPSMLRTPIWNLVTPSSFAKECQKLVHELDKSELLTTVAGFHAEGEQIEPT